VKSARRTPVDYSETRHRSRREGYHDERIMAARYRKEFLLGTGGMAEVWRANGPGGTVAIKRLLPHAARDPSLAAAFEREGRLLSKIRHPNVVGIHEVSGDEDGPFLVLEYVEGADLRTLVRSPVPARVALRVGRDVLRALSAVHGLSDENGHAVGLIHRDLSPSNVLVSANGQVKLTDFGIARALSGSHATTGQNIKGTLAYLSPEQATGGAVDARSDLFAVGALLYEMITGTSIYDEDDPRLALARARAGDVKSLGEVRPDAPADVVAIVDRALLPTPSDRFPNAQAMLDEIERVAARTHGLADDAELAAWVANAGVTRGAALPARKATRSQTMSVALGALVAIAVAAVAFAGRRAPPDAVLPAAGSAAPIAAPSATAGSLTAQTQSAPVAPAARKPAPGLLDIGSEPGFAYVSIDGVKVGSTPQFGREVTPGMHRIEVSREGLGKKTFAVEVHSGERVRRIVKLP
jgi:tRNA A-37 threonylcarbamoyl transferase component Bud32